MFKNLGKNAVIKRLTVDGTNFEKAAGNGDTLVSTVIDMEQQSGGPFVGVMFVIGVGAIAGAGTVSTSVLTSKDNAVTDAFTSILGSHNNFTAADQFQIRYTEIYKPLDRYMEFQTVRAGGSNSAVDFVLAIFFPAVDNPVTPDATVGGTGLPTSGYVVLNSPGRGTA